MQNDKTLKKSYYSITPAEVRYCKALGGGDAKHLYGEITALANERSYCWASNQYFADLYEVDARTIRRWIKQLEDNGFIFVEIKGKTRHIFITPLKEPAPLPQEPKVEVDADEEKPKKEKPVKVKFSDIDLHIAETLQAKIITNFPAFENRKVKIADWADDIRKLREIDKVPEDQIMFMLSWVHGGEFTTPRGQVKMMEPHHFWSKTIMSAAKLRKQWYDNLLPQLQDQFNKDVKKSQKQAVGKM